MKRLFLFVLGILLIAVTGFSGTSHPPEDRPPETTREDKAQFVKCPETTMQRECLTCHIAGKMPGAKTRFPVKEAAPDVWRVYPTPSMQIIEDEGYFFLTDIDSEAIKKFFNYLAQHQIKKAVIEMHSPGGALFDAQRIIGLMRYWQSQGIRIETRLFGAAFSAGFYIFTAGDVRLVDEYADLMWHEIQTFSGFGFQIETPSDKEEAARVLRHLQDIRNDYLATRGKLTKQEIDAKIARKEFWMSGKEAVEFGFADEFIK